VLAPEPRHPPGELQQLPVALRQVPVQPGDLVVLRVGVVVPPLRAPHLVAAADHRHPLREEEGGDQVAPLPLPRAQDVRPVGGPLHPEVVGEVVVVAVVVVLAVGLVVLVVVRHQVVQREAVVRDDEVDAGVRAAAVALVQVAGAGEAVAQVAQGAGVAPPVRAHRVAVLAVPLRPEDGEVPHLVAPLADVPRLGDQLHPADHRVLVDDVEEGGEPLHRVQLARQGGGQVEAEAVHVHLLHPVAQRVHHQLQRLRVAHVQRVAGAGVVHVEARRVRHQAVVGGVVDPPEGEGGPQVVPLRRVVVDHVQDHLDAGRVQRPHHLPELPHLRPVVAHRGVAPRRREEVERAVSPVVAEPLPHQELVVHHLVHGKQLDGRHPDRLQVLDHRGVRHGGVGAAQLLRGTSGCSMVRPRTCAS
jgi:hypothetical protein